MRKLLIIDTCMLCCWLRVPGKETAGPGNDHWNFDRISAHLAQEIVHGSNLVLPLASLIETGNHIAQAPDKRYECAKALAEIIVHAATARSPWVSFVEQVELWNQERLHNLAVSWPEFAKQKMSMGDLSIKEVAEYYARTGAFQVEILTADTGLKAYQPSEPVSRPRRRS